MGYDRWDESDWATKSVSYSTKSTSEIFKSSGIHPDMDPKAVKLRESCDSTENPNSTPIIVGVDVTGSMGELAGIIIKKGLGVIVQEILDRKPVQDPHVMLMAIGDANYDSAPLQVTQFESDTRLVEQLENFYLEGGGGGNAFESYDLPWVFANKKTKCDSMLKRNKKGYIFTIGDEPPPEKLTKEQIKRFLDEDVEEDISSREALTAVSKDWEVFHILLEAGYNSSGRATDKWKKFMGERVLLLSDHNKLAEVIVSAIQVNEGEDATAVSKTWSGTTELVVHKAVSGLTRSKSSSDTGVVRFS